MAVRIAHEAPISIFNDVQKTTDIDYALVHLLEQDYEYFSLFKKAVQKGREVILDNSIFELGESFNSDQYLKWINELRPTWYIIPDVLEDVGGTIAKTATWNGKYRNQAYGKTIGVVQGSSYNEIVDCYEYLDNVAEVDMIAISFDYSYYTRSFPHPNKYISWMNGRAKLLGDLVKDGIINTSKKHHLLGIGLPQEGTMYSHYPWIYSIDTSNPCVHGIKGIKYTPQGLWSKESQKLHELIGLPYDEVDLEKVGFNISKFRKFWNS